VREAADVRPVNDEQGWKEGNSGDGGGIKNGKLSSKSVRGTWGRSLAKWQEAEGEVLVVLCKKICQIAVAGDGKPRARG